jgi:hypothetical protein
MNRYEKDCIKFVESASSDKERLSPLKAIQHFCCGCVGYNPLEVKDCCGEDCPLFKFRFGKNQTKIKNN